jgi:cyclase
MTAEEPYTVELASDVYAYVQPDGGWCLNNSGFVSDGTTTLLVDTAATERRTLALAAALDATGVPRPRLLVNTHHHGDHTYGNGHFTPAATLVSHTAPPSAVARHRLRRCGDPRRRPDVRRPRDAPRR